MKLKFLFLILFLLPLLVCSQTIDSVIVHHCHDNSHNYSIAIDSFDVNKNLINTYRYDTIGTYHSRTTNIYSSSNKLLRKTLSYPSNLTWLISEENIWQYDNSDSLLSYSKLHFYQGLIYSGYTYVYSYDSSHFTTEYLYQNFNDSLNTMVNDYRFLYSHDTLSFTFKRTIQDFDLASGSWITLSRLTEVRNSSGNKISALTERWTQGTFQFSNIVFYYYLPNDSLDFTSRHSTNPADTIVTKWNYDVSGHFSSVFVSEWVNGLSAGTIDSTNYYYDSNHNQIGMSYYSQDFGLILCDSSSATYDSLNRQVDYDHSAYGSCGRSGESFWHVYNSDEGFDSTCYCSWSIATIMCNTCTFEYRSLSTGIMNVGTSTRFSVFPNPSRDDITIHCNDTKSSILFIDAIGVIRKRVKINSEISHVSTSDLSPGIYIISFEGRGMAPLRFVKL